MNQGNTSADAVPTLPDDAGRYWAFEELAVVLDLKTQLAQGLISTPEFVHKLIYEASAAGYGDLIFNTDAG